MRNRIVITGASSEIGLAVCERFANPEDHLILQCFNNKKKLIEWSERAKVSCEVVAVDFFDPSAVKAFCEQIKEADTLINLAAVTKVGLLPMLPDRDIKATISVNIMALVEICQAVLPSMLVRRKGCIVNVSSVVASRGIKGQSVYAGSKGFMESFSRALAAECGARGVRINCVAPGPIEAGSLRELLSYAEDEVVKSNVSGKLGSSENVADTIAFLCSKSASFINGRVIAVDGGFCAGV